jgi:hypothetical protein
VANQLFSNPPETFPAWHVPTPSRGRAGGAKGGIMFKARHLFLPAIDQFFGGSTFEMPPANQARQGKRLQISAFDRLTIKAGLKLRIHLGAAPRAVWNAPAEMLDELLIDQSADRLTLDLHTQAARQDAGQLDIWTRNLRELICSGSASIQLGELDGCDLCVRAEGKSDLMLSGKLDSLDLSLSGTSDLQARTCPIRRAKVDLKGACDVTLTVMEELEGCCTGASDLDYWGEPRRVSVQTSGASRATCRSRGRSMLKELK